MQLENDLMAKPSGLARLAALLAVTFMVATLGQAADRHSVARKANDLGAKCEREYRDGKYDKALETCNKAMQVWATITSPGESTDVRNHYLVGTLYAHKGDMQEAYKHWIAAINGNWPDNGSMQAISDPDARKAAQILIDGVQMQSRLGSGDLAGRGLAAADGLELLLRSQGLSAQADEFHPVVEKMRANTNAANAEFQGGHSTLSDVLSAIMVGLNSPATMRGSSTGGRGSSSASPTPDTANYSADVSNCLARCKQLLEPFITERDAANAQVDACHKTAPVDMIETKYWVNCSANYATTTQPKCIKQEIAAWCAEVARGKQDSSCSCYGSVK
jgi:hypothetical protein